MMEIEYTTHFWEQFRGRKEMSPIELTIEIIEDVIKNPDFIVEDRKPYREGRIKKIQGRCLKVVVEKDGNKLKVITIFWDRSLRRKGLCK